MECDEAGTQVDDEENNRDSGWITVTRRRSEVKKAGGALGAQTPASKPTAEAPTPGCHGFGDIKKNIIRASKMPPLPRDETKIIVRPRGGLCISKVGPSVEAEAIWEAAGLDPGERNSDTMCPNPLQNIMVVSTPSQENVKHYVNVEAITVAGQDHEVSAYVAAPHATCKGVIRGIPLSDGREAIDRKIVNARNPLALGAKRIKSTGVVIVLFDGYKVPNYVSYGGTLIKCTLYRKQVDVCYACGRLGHRSDVCPTPDASVCRACREAIQPNEHHVCEPICSLCGGKHLTASRDCKHRYQTPYAVRRRRGLRARAIQARSPSFDVDASIELNGCHHQDQPGPSATGGRSRSRGRSKTRGGSKSRSTSRARQKSRSRSGARSRSRTRSGSRARSGSSSRPDQGRADAAGTCPDSSPRPGYKYASGLQPSTAVHANEDQGRKKSNLTWADRVRSSDGEQPMQCDPPPEHARHAEVSRLRKENAELKETVSKMANEMAEFKKMLNALHSNTERETDTPVPVPAGQGPMATKRRAVVSKLKNADLR
ncbi:hypothetical protein HPB52_020725 [Rhipicephalus sanguineus]|uniref:CCHC-type domain-containing protein n=1 Tax=Rhipicephalus sanguineus TaxID=34632 RepID=A0A9D4QFE0_RHISA|nr:hypothetical protein HPB52_020725 [Rhipicephalus sanguineus]